MYGQTETTGIVSIQRVDAIPASGSVPIGRPLPGTGLPLLDDHLTPVPDGEVGEIVVTGPAMARGCLPGIRRTVRRCRPGGPG
jgi:nonribosomal peptide synthetase CepK